MAEIREPMAAVLAHGARVELEAVAAVGTGDGDGRRRADGHDLSISPGMNILIPTSIIPTGIILSMTTREHTRLLTVAEVADRLRQHPLTVYRTIRTGKLQAVRIGTGPNAPIRVDEAALEELLQPTSNERTQP